MRKRTVGALVTGVILLSAITSSETPQSSDSGSKSSVAPTTAAVESEAPKPKPTCDGKSVTTNCKLKGVSYKTYIYHAATPQKTHTEQVTTYQEKVTGYCTLCRDGTYSPSCATGRGACSWHGGVAQWNAPRTSRVPVTSSKTVVDAPAKSAYYEKVTE